MLSIIGSLLSTAADGIVDHFKDQRAIKKAETENKIRLMQSEQSHNQDWEMASLRDKDKWLRRISFAIFIWPITPIAAIAPSWILKYYEALEAIPEWNLQLIMIMIGGIWGVAELKQSLPGIVGFLTKGSSSKS